MELWGSVSFRSCKVPLTSIPISTQVGREYLENITAVGPRTVGSPENEILTVNYLLKQIKAIEIESSDAHKISVDIQRPTGSFSIDFLGGFTSYYANITNVVVKLEPRSGAKHAVLSNCHFDSVPNTPGASDDAVSCSVMLEILNTLSKSSDPLQHAVIFLFNGAEENILQASHGFITQHRWAKSIRAFINLEAAGVGGKELVFQTGPENPWLVQAYVFAAKHPFASVVAQEVFQSGIIPADTDFRIYRDFGNIPGIDLAFIENGYIYHTKYDTPDRILTDSIQRAGDNILGMLKYLATSDKLAKSFDYRHGNVVFFDVFGLFVLAYPARVGTIMNYIITAVTVLYLGKKILQPRNRAINYMKELSIAFGFTLLSWFSTLVTVLIVAVFISLIGRSLSWYNHFYVSIFLYGTAAAAKLILVHTLAKKFYYKNTNEQYLGEMFFDVSLLVWSIALVLITQLGLCSAFICAMWVAFPLLTKLLTYREFKQKGATIRFVVIYMLGMFIPYLYIMYLTWTIFEMFIPIMGRSGTEIPPDVVLAAFILSSTVILSSYFLNFIYLAKSTKKTLITLTTVFGVTLILVCSGVFFPYSSDSANPKPKRVFLQPMPTGGPPSPHDSCLRCLGESHQADKCHICKAFKPRTKKERDFRLKQLIMEAALSLVPSSVHRDSALSSVRSAPVAPTGPALHSDSAKDSRRRGLPGTSTTVAPVPVSWPEEEAAQAGADCFFVVSLIATDTSRAGAESIAGAHRTSNGSCTVHSGAARAVESGAC
ncbi:Endoplasmic reticulum metallopeptidase 1 [Chelonia mydas]|uniref:Endoplasmic reticulum metallopeptidase 1 n=1 Tax=Chelonia mydas TaxID=8469 RepID=M7B0C0_CHEMY|nr:Endoplasmic reticulum metallopeptidase 1 [Chelonia mydas]